MISRWKKPCKEIPSRKKFQHWKKNFSWGIILEKSLALLYVGEKIISLEVCRKKFLPKPNDPHPPPPQKSNGQPLSCFFFHFLQCLSLLFSYMVWKTPFPYTNIYLNSIKVVHDNITTVTVDIKGTTREEDLHRLFCLVYGVSGLMFNPIFLTPFFLCVTLDKVLNMQYFHTLQGTLYTGLYDGRIVKLEGDKVIDVVQTGKQPCGMSFSYVYVS